MGSPPLYDLILTEDRYGRAYLVAVDGRTIGIVRETSARGAFRWEATAMDGSPICTGSTRREVAETVVARSVR